jgi:hypothetical protein
MFGIGVISKSWEKHDSTSREKATKVNSSYTFRNNTQAEKHPFPLTNIKELHRSTGCHLKYYKVHSEKLPDMKPMLIEKKFSIFESNLMSQTKHTKACAHSVD